MGTSSPHPGSNDRSPLVPAHADAEPSKPVPPPQPHRFKQFRTNMGRFFSSGSRSELESGLKNYAGTATGGASVGPRRFGTTINAGAALISALSSLATGATPATPDGFDPKAFAAILDALGKPLNIAIDILAEALTPTTEDADKICDALKFALSESLQNLEGENGDTEASLDVSVLNEELYTDTLINYLAEAVFQDIVFEAGTSHEKQQAASILEEREEELRETVVSAIDKHLSPHVDDGIANLSSDKLRDIQLQALKDVFSEWEDLK